MGALRGWLRAATATGIVRFTGSMTPVWIVVVQLSTGIKKTEISAALSVSYAFGLAATAIGC